jgi:hypothetical protein
MGAEFFRLRSHKRLSLGAEALAYKGTKRLRDTLVMTNKRMKFPIQDFPIRGTILTPAVRAAAIRDAVASLAAEGALIRGKYLGCPPAKAAKKR